MHCPNSHYFGSGCENPIGCKRQTGQRVVGFQNYESTEPLDYEVTLSAHGRLQQI